MEEIFSEKRTSLVELYTQSFMLLSFLLCFHGRYMLCFQVVVERNTKQAYSEIKGNRDHITAHVALSASGFILPPFLIFEQSFPSGPYARSGPDNALYAVSPNRYMDAELFMK